MVVLGEGFYTFEGEDPDTNSDQFKKRYRFRKETVEELAEILQPEIGPFCKCHDAFSAEQRLALHFYAVGSFQKAVGDGEGASQSTMCRIISRVSSVLANHMHAS